MRSLHTVEVVQANRSETTVVQSEKQSRRRMIDDGEGSRRTRHELDVVTVIARVFGSNCEIEGLTLRIDEAAENVSVDYTKSSITKKIPCLVALNCAARDGGLLLHRKSRIDDSVDVADLRSWRSECEGREEDCNDGKERVHFVGERVCVGSTKVSVDESLNQRVNGQKPKIK